MKKKNKRIYVYSFVDDKLGALEIFFDSKIKPLGFVDQYASVEFRSLQRMYAIVNIDLHFLPRDKEEEAIGKISKMLTNYEFVKRYERSLKVAKEIYGEMRY